MWEDHVERMWDALSKLAVASAWQPAGNWGPQSYVCEEWNSANNLNGHERGPKRQSTVQLLTP